MNIYTHYALWRDRVAAAGLVDRFSVCVTMRRATLSRGIDRTRARPQFRNPEGLIAQDFVTSPQGVLALAGRAARSSEPSIKW